MDGILGDPWDMYTKNRKKVCITRVKYNVIFYLNNNIYNLHIPDMVSSSTSFSSFVKSKSVMLGSLCSHSSIKISCSFNSYNDVMTIDS